MIVPKVDIPKKASRVGVLDPNRRMDFTVVLANKVPLPAIHPARSKNPIKKHLTHDELWHRYGASVESVKVVEAFAKTFNLEIIETAVHRRNMRLAGRSADIARAFGTKFYEFELNGHKFFAPILPLRVPAKWDGVVEAVLGTHNSPHSRPRRRSAIRGHEATTTLNDLGRAYAFPSDFDGSGETFGLIEFGGGFYPEDIKEFSSRLGVAEPNITIVEIGRAANRPASRRDIHQYLDVLNSKAIVTAKTEQSDSFVAAQATAEVTMDVEILAALAPAARIVVYFASGGEQGFYNAISHAVHDDHHRPGILSISWGLPEHTFSLHELN
ncbi:MAG TPA: protease pro-enzyme activation domain-containing protein, partial [Candidatus Acidoferrum sp.]|nr:protease pro-enzyme activation domain-containing protein [Candidatus Acidoferrum sp.]